MSHQPHVKGGPTRGVWVDDEGLIHIPGKQPESLIAPSSGSDYERMKSADLQAQEERLQMERDLRSVWSCTQCKKQFSAMSYNEAAGIRRRSPAFKTDPKTGVVKIGMPICPFCLDCDPRSNVPIVRIHDALNLRRAPGGRI